MLVTAAFAEAPAKSREDVAHEALDAAYGKPVPDAAVCLADPELPGRFVDVLAVGARQGQRGCVLFGVLVGETWYAPDAALAAAVDPEAWKLVDAAQRGRDLLAWTDGVLLAFAQPLEGEGSVAPSKGGWIVERPYLRREDAAGRSVEATGRWTFGANPLAGPAGAAGPAQVAAEETIGARYETVLTMRADRLEGVPDAAVQSALTAHGGAVRQCFQQAWEQDLALAGKVRLAWTVTGGKADAVGVIADDAPPPDLAACYARAVRAGAYPPEITGKVRWVFSVERRVVE
jgi:hypothetical protein